MQLMGGGPSDTMVSQSDKASLKAPSTRIKTKPPLAKMQPPPPPPGGLNGNKSMTSLLELEGAGGLSVKDTDTLSGQTPKNNHNHDKRMSLDDKVNEYIRRIVCQIMGEEYAAAYIKKV
jgi:hypothetical protein